MRQRLDERSDQDLRAHDDADRSAGPLRPEAPPGVGDRVRDWVEWFGLARLVTSAIAVVVVCAGAWFLVRTPPPPSEAALPMATSTSVGVGQASAVATSGAPTAATTTAGGPVVVHVAGAVASPGVYELEPGSRVDDAVRRAGGTTGSADPGQLNLASPVADGDRVYVPEEGEELPVSPAAGPASDDTTPAGPIDVNRASDAELQRLPGVGPATAAAIVTERDLNGPFSSFEDLERVPGIGPAKLAALTGLVTM